MAIVLPSTESELRHIFRDADGHVPDTPANREMLLGVANDPASLLASDRYGNVWSAHSLADGSQVWTQVRNGKMINGGVNTVSRALHQETGLKRP